MTMNLSSLKPNLGSSEKRKRVGRGNGSGHGTYSTRGLKGQKSRSGVSNLKRLGLKKMLLSVPKSRGFKSTYDKNQVVNLVDINKFFKPGEAVTPAALVKHGLISHADQPVKILGKGDLKIADLKFKGLTVSATAAKAIADNKGIIN